ncbi:interleukin-34-like [Brienomyrus brachyistius]|uniref:interleukin-34-like n=1 Tax=Brienomyrus brachyistius TaxID=42636 RepID=UPI0020B32399|nr:interleukin-34-like [Brienomyrus brachyistius]
MPCPCVSRLGTLLVLLWVLPPLMTSSTPSTLCTSLTTLKSGLQSPHRRQLLKHNFPLNYTIRVRPQEVFRLHNINKLKAKVPDLKLRHLQHLWVMVNQEVLKKTLRILPERHPSRRHISDLERLLKMVQQVQHEVEEEAEEEEPPEEIKDIMAKLRDSDVRTWKWVTPKSLVDNCFRTMHCLFDDCFLNSNADYCNFASWRKDRKPTLQA